MVLVLWHEKQAKERWTWLDRVVQINFRFNLTKVICAYHLAGYVSIYLCITQFFWLHPAEEEESEAQGAYLTCPRP